MNKPQIIISYHMNQFSYLYNPNLYKYIFRQVYIYLRTYYYI